MLTRPEDWLCFFPRGTKVIAIPNWRKPRVLLPLKEESSKTTSLLSRFFIAHSKAARMYKNLLKAWVILGRRLPIKLNKSRCLLDPFVKDMGIEFEDVVVVVGRPAPIQKIKIALLNSSVIVGFIKYAERELAQQRIRHEFNVLSSLPSGFAPSPLKIGKLMKGIGVLLSPVNGTPVTAQLPTDEVIEFQERLIVHRNVTVSEHPWIWKLKKEEDVPVARWLAPLSQREWDIVLHHGDFVPWNLLRVASGQIVAVDWEFSDLNGFPFLDLAYYILQYGALVKRWSPKFAFIYTRGFLNKRFSLGPEISESLVRLAAFQAYRITAQNGRDDNWPLQKWRRRVWEIEP